MARSWSLPTPWAVVAVTGAFLLAACAASTPTPAPDDSAGAASPGTTSSAGEPSAADVGAASSLVSAVRLDSPESLASIEGVRFTPAGSKAAADLLASGASGDALWAATYVYASSGDSPEPLRAIATNTGASPSVRVMAAAGLLGRGDIAGFDPLIAALATSDPMDGMEPAGTTSEFAADVLERYAKTGFGPALTASEDERAAGQAQWRAWLDANRATLQFDPASESWVTK
jgi:hypothetical protein